MFILAFQTENDTFKSFRREVSVEVLRRVIADVRRGQVKGGVYDSNGIKIGSYQLTEED